MTEHRPFDPRRRYSLEAETAPTGIDLEAIRARHEEMERIIADQGTALHLTTWIRTRNETHTDRAALLALAASQAEQIAGMAEQGRWVPNEPTEEMIEAGRSAVLDGDTNEYIPPWAAKAVYEAMIRAAKAAYDATERKPTDG